MVSYISELRHVYLFLRMEGIVISRSYNCLPGRKRKVLVLFFLAVRLLGIHYISYLDLHDSERDCERTAGEVV